MSTAGAAPTAPSSPADGDEGPGVQRVVVVYDCTRLGRTANPPGFSLLDFFRRGRRRRR